MSKRIFLAGIFLFSVLLSNSQITKREINEIIKILIQINPKSTKSQKSQQHLYAKSPKSQKSQSKSTPNQRNHKNG